MTGGELAAAMQRNATAAIVGVSRLIASVHITLSLLCGEQKRQNAARVKYWEIIARNLKKRGWSLGYVSALDSNGRTISIVDAHRGDGAGPPRCSTQRAGIAPPHAAGEGLSGATSDGEFGFISGPAAFVGGVPLTRARNPWAMPEAST